MRPTCASPSSPSRSERDALAVVAHEVRGPVAALGCALEVLVDALDAGDLDAARALATGARDAALHLDALATRLLDVTRPRGGAVDADDVLASAIRDHAALAARRSVAIEAEFGAARVTGDAVELRQVVDNLLRNAIRHARRGGTVWVRTRAGSLATTIEIEDDGAGIDPSLDAFAPWTTGAASSAEGTGLGLDITARIVSRRGGTIALEARVGGGTVARVTLPAPVGTSTGRRIDGDELLGLLRADS